MPPAFPFTELFRRFFAPLTAALESPTVTPHRRACFSLSDSNWLLFGTYRALQLFSSGREFLQHLAAVLPDAPARSLFFESLKSPRRLHLAAATNSALCRSLDASLPDPLAAFPELHSWHLFAGDGHYHAAAVHDPHDPSSGIKYPTGHFFGLNLRSHTLFHLTVADQIERRHEHDLRAIKRLEIASLRQAARQGERVLWVWDRAVLDFRFWHALKARSGIYFLSRDKDNTKLQMLGPKDFDRSAPHNEGVLRDEHVGSSNGIHLRRIVFLDVITGETFIFLTSEFTLPPGLLVALYRLRWNIEKVFDETKNKLGERKAWASSPEAKSAQAQFICLTHNLLLSLEFALEKEDGVRNEAEIARRAKRLTKATQEVKVSEDTRLAADTAVKETACPETAASATDQARPGARASIPQTVHLIQRLTVRSVKFIRWVRALLFADLSWAALIAPLRLIYATL